MKIASMILSPHDNLNAASASWALKRLGVETVWASSLSDSSIGCLTVDAGQGAWACYGWHSDVDLRSIWWHRPRSPRAPKGLLSEDASFVECEWLHFQRNIFAMADGAFDTLWINEPAQAMRAENKLIQLNNARSLGIAIPPTLVSNDPIRVRKFVAEHGKVIYKSFAPHIWTDNGTTRPHCAVATLIDDIGALSDASISLCPGIYQRYVEKTCDIRVTIVGNRFFPVRITKDSGSAFVDWRPRSQLPDLVARPCELPGAYQSKLASLMRALGLVYGCIDLVADADGDLHFLEVNQSGQYLFVEEWLPELPLLGAMCCLLSQGRLDYSLDLTDPISLGEYYASDEYLQWREQCDLTQHAIE